MTIVTAALRNEVADFLSALLYVYLLLILAYIVISLLINFGVRPPYSRAFDAVFGFLRDVVEPYLRIFRRFIPPIGPLDLSPIVGIILLQIVGGIIINIVDG